MSKIICDHDKCTGCAACRDICPRNCITMCPDALDSLYPVVDETQCVNCGLCKNTCPNNCKLIFRQPQKVWAAWSNDDKVRTMSASGGIAYELYRYWIKEGGVAVGVVYERDGGCHYVLIEVESDIQATQNSKYTFSDTVSIYKIVKRKLQAGVPVLFIGVPCQVAGLYGFLKKDYENLVTVDIICHGMPPAAYLQQHVEFVESLKNERTSLLCFRDPKYHTDTFTFTLKDNAGKEFYKKKVLSGDNYQLGYHRALIYRENCYSCNYARADRISDLTIGDFSGLGNVTPIDYNSRNVSCILQNSLRGADLLHDLGSAISLRERPMREAFEYEKQLKSPSIKHIKRDVFESEYRVSKDFEKAASIALEDEKKAAASQRIIMSFRSFFRCVMPMSKIRRIKWLFRKRYGTK